ncbi:MAG: GNAT family N-acetyltransferase, partial [Promethearchaeota archaeon]
MDFKNIQYLNKIDVNFALNMVNIEGWGTTKEEIQDLLDFSPKKSCGFLAKIGEKPVGMIITISYDKFGFIGNLIVDKNYRNHGIGQELMKKAINHLINKGNKSIMLDGVPEAVPLYERLGFRKICKSLRLDGKIISKQNDVVFQMKLD